jgi:uncharacterized protein
LILYLDASAAVRLLIEHPETGTLQFYLDEMSQHATIVSSVMIETELRRTAAERGAPQILATNILAGVNLIDPLRSHFAMAGLLPVRGLRSLDALHLITAMRAEADVLIAYERALIEAAASVGLASISPV